MDTADRLRLQFHRSPDRQYSRRADRARTGAERYPDRADDRAGLRAVLHRAGPADRALFRPGHHQPSSADRDCAGDLVGDDRAVRAGAEFLPAAARADRGRGRRGRLYAAGAFADQRPRPARAPQFGARLLFARHPDRDLAGDDDRRTARRLGRLADGLSDRRPARCSLGAAGAFRAARTAQGNRCRARRARHPRRSGPRCAR